MARSIRVDPAGELHWAGRRYRCALGVGGVRADKREGDGATPCGRFPLRRLLYRPDRLPPPATQLPLAPLSRDDGWCDDADDPLYNRPVQLPYAGCREERMWRDDALYDLVVVVGYNDDPVVPRKGSAIFLHVAGPGFRPTQGCIALARDDLLAVLVDVGPDVVLDIEPPRGP